MNHFILWFLFFQPIFEHHAHLSNIQKNKSRADHISIHCAISTPKKGIQQAIYNPKNCFMQTGKRSVKA
jgi:hypothetical protein